MTRAMAAGATFLVLIGLAGCETDDQRQAPDNLSGTEEQFESMVQPCTDQAQRLTGVSTGSISVTDRIRTGGGPILTLTANGAPYTCRLESNGSVTVFSEFAN